MSAIKPFKIAVPDADIEALKKRLELSAFPDDFDFSENWNYGVPLADIKRLASRWRDGFDWRAQEAKLNEIPQFTTKITVDGFDELEVHFVHQQSNNKDSIPLLFCHGCKIGLNF